MAYVLFLLVNVALLVRPSEIIPDWQGLELYFYLIVACALCGLPQVLGFLTGRSLEAQPITLCVLGMQVLSLIPPLLALKVDEAWNGGFTYFKLLVYYLLLVSLVNTPARLRGLVMTLVPCCAVLSLITILRYHGVLELAVADASVEDSTTNAWGEVTYFQRLQGTGIFQDPNDLCMMLASMVPLALYLLIHDKNSLRRVLWLGSFLIYGYAIFLTRSRGGLLALASGLGICCWARYGLQRSLVLASLGLPLLLVVFGGRQTTMTAQEGTGQTRIQLWSDWMMEFRGNLPFGRGMTLPKEGEGKKQRFPGENYGHMAHNSYLQAFADIGLLGGCLFLGAYGVALLSIYRAGQGGPRILDPQQQALRPFMLAAVMAYAVGMLTLSLCFVVPTFMILALAVAYTRTTVCWPAQPPLRMDERLLGRFALAGASYLAVMYVFIRLFVNRF
jgi:hypothetical protein